MVSMYTCTITCKQLLAVAAHTHTHTLCVFFTDEKSENHNVVTVFHHPRTGYDVQCFLSDLHTN